jgi:hypothetical protein
MRHTDAFWHIPRSVVSRWGWPGLFQVDVPETWDVEDLSDAVEIRAPHGVGAIYVSVVRPTGNQAAVVDPTPILQGWADPATARGFTLEGPDQVTGLTRAWAHWYATLEETEAVWVLVGVSLPGRVLVGSHVGSVDEPAAEREAREILGSLADDA